MDTTEKQLEILDTNMTQLTNEYYNLHKELDKYRGLPLEDTNLKEVNRIIDKIQDVFECLHPLAYFIAHRYEWACNIANTHDEFIKSIVSAGATAEEKH